MQLNLPKNSNISISPIKSFSDNYIWLIEINVKLDLKPGYMIMLLQLIKKKN